MTDQEFRDVAAQWLALQDQLLALTRERSDLHTRLDQAVFPATVTSLDEICAVKNARAALDSRLHDVTKRARAVGERMTELESTIRNELPANVWYRVDGRGIQVAPHVAIQVKKWEEVDETNGHRG